MFANFLAKNESQMNNIDRNYEIFDAKSTTSSFTSGSVQNFIILDGMSGPIF